MFRKRRWFLNFSQKIPKHRVSFFNITSNQNSINFLSLLLIHNLYDLVSWKIRNPLIRQDLHSLEDMARKLFFVHIQHLVNNGVLLLGRLIWILTIELNQMLCKKCLLLNVNSIILYKRLKDVAPLQVDSKLTLNYLMRPHGKLNRIPILTSWEPNIGTDLINQSHSINQPYKILMVDWIEEMDKDIM